MHHNNPSLGHFWVQYYNTYNIFFQKYGSFNFEYQFWFLNPTIIIYKKMMSCNFLKIILNFITYIERSMTIFIIYIGIIRSLSCFDYTNFKFSLVIKIINFNLKNSNGPSSYAFHFPCECDYVSKFQCSTNLLHLC